VNDIAGPVNVTSPNPLPNREFMRALRQAWGARVGLPATEWMVEIGTFVLRSESELVLKSRRVVPGRLLDAGFEFRHPTWQEAARGSRRPLESSGVKTAAYISCARPTPTSLRGCGVLREPAELPLLPVVVAEDSDAAAHSWRPSASSPLPACRPTCIHPGRIFNGLSIFSLRSN